MIKTFLLIFSPASTWEKIENEQQNVTRIFFLFLLPLLLFSTAGEAWGLLKFGKEQGLNEILKPFPQDLVVRYEGFQAGVILLILFALPWLFQKIGASFHRRHTYIECFATLAYSVGPFLFVRPLAGFPWMNPWVCWGIGIFLAVAALYRGIPRLMKPDPSSALGLYLMCSLVLITVTGVAQFLAGLVLDEKLLATAFKF